MSNSRSVLCLIMAVACSSLTQSAWASSTTSSVESSWPRPEVRTVLGANASKPSDLNSIVPSEDQVDKTVSFGADLIADFDDYGFGIRFDSISFFNGATTAPTALEVSSRVFSLLARYRWSSESRFVGPLLTYGFYIPSVVNIRPIGDGWIQYEADRTKSLSLGLEAGWIWGVYLVGFEGGYHQLQMSQLATKAGTPLLAPTGNDLTVDLSGVYAKFLLGLHF